MPSPTHVVYCGYTVGVGTRYEKPDEQGMAHFMEHMSFKGTIKRRAWHILNRMEVVGGDLNAFTTKEETVFYTACIDRDFERAVELLTDIVFHSTYPDNEIGHEVRVILDEIDSYKDTPSELIFDEFEGILFDGDALAGNILGSPDLLKSFTSRQASSFAEKFYNPSNCVFFVYGNLKWMNVLHIIEKHIAKEKDRCNKPLIPGTLPDYNVKDIEKHEDTHQAHMIIGTRGAAGASKDQLPLYLLNNILGGPGMNSLLNVSLREKRGLCYNIESNLSSYTDTGVFSIYFGCDQHNIDRCRQLTLDELDRLCQGPLTDNQLKRAKKQLVGQLGVSSDNFENVALGMGKSWLLYNRYYTRTDIMDMLENITSEQLLDVARRYFKLDSMSSLLYH